MSKPSIAVVIPYYQREPFVLRRTLESVIAQTFQPEQVVIVDDGSPRTAGLEISGDLHKRLRGLTLVLQSNRGISAARNAGLANLYGDIDTIAFLDSDDVWEPNHLEYAARALSQGADFFFSNFRRPDTEDAFETDPGRRHLKSPDGPLTRWTQGVPALMRSSCPFITSTVVYRRAILPTLRFSTRYRRAGEDHIAFWQLCLRAYCIMYSTQVTVNYADDGVGMWQNSTGDTMPRLVRLTDEIRMRRYIMRHFPVYSGDEAQIHKAISARREMAFRTALHLIRRGHNAYGEVLRLFFVDPGCALAWAAAFPKELRRWMNS